MRIRRFILMALLLAALPIARAQAQTAPLPWSPWAALDLFTMSDDGTGAAFALDAVDGIPALQITPGGTSDETKLAYPLSGADLSAWTTSTALQMDVYLPATNALNPNAFFLGLADVTSAWTWVGGQFGAADGGAGWITVTFPLDGLAQAIEPNGAYMLYLSFFEQGSKTPLTEAFYVAALSLLPAEGPATIQPGADPSVTALLALDDSAFLDAVARATFDYFWYEADPDTGLIRDRSNNSAVASIAAVGFGLAAIPVAVERGWISAEDGQARAALTLNTFVSGGVEGERGFFYHFVDMRTGQRVWNSELSSIDTALLAAGALVAGQYFQDTPVQALANTLYEAIDWDWMRNNGEFVRMGWTPEGGFLGAAWDHFDESQLLYALAIGSPTHPVPASVWDVWNRPIRVSQEYIYLPGEPLFVYQYPQAFLNLRGLEDHFANYWNNTVRACAWNQQFAADNAHLYATYENGVWGLSASDGPEGYRAYGASEVNHDGTIAPYASASCLPFTPEIALDGMRALLREYGAQVWRDYGFVSAINEAENWYSREHIGIDQGAILLMISNVQDGLVWDRFTSHPAVQSALSAMGFVASAGDYAITPAYWQERIGP
jgi:hypothetical protein